MKETSPADLSFLVDVLKRQNSHRESSVLQKIKDLVEKGAPIVDRSLLLEIGYTFPAGKDAFLSEFPSYETYKAVENIDITFEIFKKSYNDLIEEFGKYHSAVVFNKDNTFVARDEEINIRYKIYSFCSNAEMLVSAYRRLDNAKSGLEKLRKSLFASIFRKKEGLPAFIKELRNAIQHQEIIEVFPYYEIKFDRPREAETHFRVRAPRFFSQKARSYIGDGEMVDIEDHAQEYFEKTVWFYYRFKTFVGLHKDMRLADIYRIKEAQSASSLRMNMGLLLQGISKKGRNGREYLYNYFRDDEIRRISSLSFDTRKMVDYAISLRDPLGLCDEHTRQSLYALFEGESTLDPEQQSRQAGLKDR